MAQTDYLSNPYESTAVANKTSDVCLTDSGSNTSHKRVIGTFEGIATFTEVGDGKITEEEFLGA